MPLLIYLLALFLTASPARAEPLQDCYATFYKTHDTACLKATLGEIAASGNPHMVNPIIQGFFAELFRSNPEAKERLLELARDGKTKVTFIAALEMAGLPDEAVAYADAQHFHGDMTEGSRLITTIKPVSSPNDNDLLIGAYMASGNADYIRAIFSNFSSATDGMAADAVRIGLLQRRAGPGMTALGRKPEAAVKAACEKYSCHQDMQDLTRVMTLASAFWATDSLAKNDEGISKALMHFLDADPRLKKIFAVEKKAFADYGISAVAANFSREKDPKLEAALSAYEELGPAEDLLNNSKKNAP